MTKIATSLLTFSNLQEYGVNSVFTTDTEIVQKKNIKSYFFFVRTKIPTIYKMCKQIKSLKGKSKVYVFLIPRRMKIIDEIFEHEKIVGKIKLIHTFGFDFLPIDRNVFSCFISNSYRELELNKNIDILYLYARCIIKFESFFGLFDEKMYIGKRGREVLSIVKSLHKKLEPFPIYSLKKPKKFNKLIIFDRNVDLVSPLITPVTYEGLVNYCYRIKESGRMSEPIRENLILNDYDSIFKTVRDVKISKVMSKFQEITKEIGKLNIKFEEMKKDNQNGKKLGEFKEILGEFPDYKMKKGNLKDHAFLLEEMNEYFLKLKEIMDVEKAILSEQQKRYTVDLLLHNEKRIDVFNYVENLIIQKEKLEKVLSFFVLFSIVNNGIKKDKLEYLKKEIIHTYGIQSLLIFKKLEDLNLLNNYEKKPKFFSKLRKMFSLYNPESEGGGIQDIYENYSALSIKLVEEVVKNSEKIGILKKEGIIEVSELKKENEEEKQSNVVVFFLGGCSRGELSSLRKLERINENLNIVILTSELFPNFLEQFTKV